MGPRPPLTWICPLLPALLLLGGCAALPWLAQAPKRDPITVSPEGEDGTRYISVESGPLSSARTVRSRWKNTARKVCEGDYQLISESGGTRRQNGVTRSRTHEGFIQCILPDENEPAGPGAPTMADATTPSPRLRQR